MCKVCSLDAKCLQVDGIVLKELSLGQRVRFATIEHRWSDLQILSCKFSFHCYMKVQGRILQFKHFLATGYLSF